MKIAISATSPDLDGDIAGVFGRCPYFIIVEMVNGQIGKATPIKNIYADQAGGAGLEAAKLVAEQGAEAVLAENVGPRALTVLEQFNIKVFTDRGQIKPALQNLAGKN